MQRYILVRAFQALVVLLLVSMVIFGLSRLTGNPVYLMLPPEASQDDVERLNAHLGLDRPLPVQYGVFLVNALKGDLGESIRFKRPALQLVLERLPATLRLGLLGFSIALFLAIPIGVYSAKNRNTVLDFSARGFAIVGQSMPHFAIGIILILLLSVWAGLLPSSGMGSFRYYILPGITLGYYATAGIMRLTRSAMLEVLDSEYIKLARAKGLRESMVLWKHAFKNAVIPVLTFSTLVFVRMIAGSMVTELIFAWPGVGRLAIESIKFRDYPVVQTVVLITCGLFVAGNLLTDILYAYVNPRIRYRK